MKDLASQLDEISVALLKHNSVDEMFNEFVEIVDENAPYKTLSKKEIKGETTMDH